MLLCAVVGSGIMAERLAAGNIAVALLANTVATGAALLVLILALAPISGAHFNPVVSVVSRMLGDLSSRDLILYILVQTSGAVFGVVLANLMFDLPAVSMSSHVRTGFGVWLGEFVATFGLVGVITSVSRRHDLRTTALAVAAFITSAYWFTSSTSFANPAVTFARSLSDSFTGIRISDVAAFVLTQVVAAIAAAYFFDWLIPRNNE
jgi:glycerol uptake facilitator-like aquaporin